MNLTQKVLSAIPQLAEELGGTKCVGNNVPF